jgi:hypothetical protein
MNDSYIFFLKKKRFEHGTSTSKIETKIKFPVDLDLTPFTSNKKKHKYAVTIDLKYYIILIAFFKMN